MLLPLLLPLLLSLSACSDVRYLAQAAWGQVSLLASAKPITDVIANPATPTETRRKLQLALEVRQFAFNDLGLPQQQAFLSYVQLDRKNVSWSVVAAPEFSLQLETWCYPIVGCVTYKGYFNENAAKAEAKKWQTKGYDAVVQGVGAYSTLGYLPDPLLSTSIEGSDMDLVSLLVHELSHGALYVAGDTAFNESFATAIELEGVRRWAEQHHQDAPKEEWQQDLQYQQTQEKARLAAVTQLQSLYVSQRPAEELRAEKAKIYEALRVALNTAREERGYLGRWSVGSLNNANVGQMGSYFNLVPNFQALLKAKMGDIPAFIEAARTCSKLPKDQRPACLLGQPN